MTATDELRRMLDERGVEYEVDEHGWVFFDVDGFGWIYVPSDTHGQLIHQRLLITPAQAIAATLGSCNCTNGERTNGTCHEVMIDRFFRGCSECGYMWEFMYGIGRGQRPNFCPNCGRKVVTNG